MAATPHVQDGGDDSLFGQAQMDIAGSLNLRRLDAAAAEAEFRLRAPEIKRRIQKLAEGQVVPQELWETVVGI